VKFLRNISRIISGKNVMKLYSTSRDQLTNEQLGRMIGF